jgi:adenylate cyclase
LANWATPIAWPGEALQAFRVYNARNPGFGLVDIVLVDVHADRPPEARRAAAELMAAEPAFTIQGWLATQLRSDTEQLARDVDSLRSAGLPEV